MVIYCFSNTKLTFLFVYVNDIIISGENLIDKNMLKQELTTQLEKKKILKDENIFEVLKLPILNKISFCHKKECC